MDIPSRLYLEWAVRAVYILIKLPCKLYDILGFMTVWFSRRSSELCYVYR